MTRKHFEAIAATLRERRAELNKLPAHNETERLVRLNVLAEHDNTVHALCHTFADANANFDTTRFFAACKD